MGISVKAVEAAAKARKEALAGGEVESRKRRQQRERRQRQLALTLGAPPGAQRPLSLKDSRRESGHSGAAATTAAQPAKLAHPQPAAAAIAQSSGPLKKGLLKKKTQAKFFARCSMIRCRAYRTSLALRYFK